MVIHWEDVNTQLFSSLRIDILRFSLSLLFHFQELRSWICIVFLWNRICIDIMHSDYCRHVVSRKNGVDNLRSVSYFFVKELKRFRG
jgi:hypothetical protein